MSPYEMEGLLLYYTELDMDQIEQCMNVFVDRWRDNVSNCESHSEVAEYISIGMVVVMTAGTLYGLAPYAIPGAGLLIEEAGDDAQNAVDTFWFGGRDMSGEFAESIGTTLEMSEEGQQLLIDTAGMSRSASKPLWDALSKNAAESASGTVNCVIYEQALQNPEWVADSLFFGAELPALMSNTNVSALQFYYITKYGNVVPYLLKK